MSKDNGAGKGDSYRPVDYKKYSENYDRIFGKKKEQINAESGITEPTQPDQQRVNGVVKGERSTG